MIRVVTDISAGTVNMRKPSLTRLQRKFIILIVRTLREIRDQDLARTLPLQSQPNHRLLAPTNGLELTW